MTRLGRTSPPGALRRAALALVAAALLDAAAGAGAAAQERMLNGFWADAGVGYGRLRLHCTNCADDGTVYGGTVTLTIGRSLSPRVVVGLEGQVWSDLAAAPHEQVRSLTIVVQWYPWMGRRFFVRGGTGIVQGPVVPSVSGAPSETVKGTGVGLTLGVGYDIPLDAHLALAVQAATHVAALGDLDMGGVTLQDTIAYVTRFAVALVIR